MVVSKENISYFGYVECFSVRNKAVEEGAEGAEGAKGTTRGTPWISHQPAPEPTARSWKELPRDRNKYLRIYACGETRVGGTVEFPDWSENEGEGIPENGIWIRFLGGVSFLFPCLPFYFKFFCLWCSNFPWTGREKEREGLLRGR